MPPRSESADCWSVYKAGHEASVTHQITRNAFLTRLLRCFEGLRDSCVQSVSSPVSQAACVFQPPRRCLASKSTHNQRNSTSTRRYVLWGVSNYVRPLERVHFSVLLRNHAFSSYVTCLFRLVRIALATRYDAPRVFFLSFFFLLLRDTRKQWFPGAIIRRGHVGTGRCASLSKFIAKLRRVSRQQTLPSRRAQDGKVRFFFDVSSIVATSRTVFFSVW